MEISYAIERQFDSSGGDKISKTRKYLAVCSVICFFFSLAPYLLYNIANEGSLCILLLGVFLSICTLVYPDSTAKSFRRSVWRLLRGLLWIFIVGQTLVSGLMLCSILFRPAIGEARTVVVLGCQTINGKPSNMLKGRLESALHYLNRSPASKVLFRPAIGEARTVVVLGCQTINGKPSNMLKGRLESALHYLNRSPASKVVVSGYVSAGDNVTQAEVMRDWFLENGIAEDRIFMEKRAIDTATNIANTARIIADNNLQRSIAIATDAYHIPRAVLYANMYELDGAAALPSISAPLLIPIYWVREQLGIVEALFF